MNGNGSSLSFLDILLSIEDTIQISILEFDAIYFNAAKRCYLEANNSIKKIDKAYKRYYILTNKIERIEEKYKHSDYDEGYDKIESLCIQQEDAEYQIRKSYGPFIQQICLTHILAILTLEAHINFKADELLKGKEKDNFLDLSLESKWMFLPKILQSGGFNYGIEPFQSFSRLIKIRNKLVHYKPKDEDWQLIEENFPIKDFGISLDHAEKSLKTVKDMIIQLADFLKIESPHWVTERFESFSPKQATYFFKFKEKKIMEEPKLKAI